MIIHNFINSMGINAQEQGPISIPADHKKDLFSSCHHLFTVMYLYCRLSGIGLSVYGREPGTSGMR